MSGKVKVKEVDSQTQARLSSLFEVGWDLTRFGDGSYLMPSTYKDDADQIMKMAIRPDDVWVATFARCGTTWTQELVWMLTNDLDYETPSKIPLMGRYMFLEVNHVLKAETLLAENADSSKLQKFASTMPSVAAVLDAPSPRFIKTHMPFSLLPPNLLDTAKVVYVARDPRDVAVSYYHHNRLFYKYTGDFKTYWNLFMNDLVVYSPFFAHVKEAWALRHHKNLLFIFYEDMTRDLASTAKRVANFYGKEVTDEQITKLCDYLDIENFRNNKSVNMSFIMENVKHTSEVFIRKGKSGAWREQFDEEMTAQAQRWMDENLAGSDLRFPEHTQSLL